MMQRSRQDGQQGQRGAALLIVLLLIATLAFIALSITERTALAAARSVNARIRTESQWLAFGAETLARAALEAAYDAAEGKMSLDDPWATQPLEVPIDHVAARLSFAAATACFNINGLTPDADAGDALSGADDPAIKEFALLARNIGLSEFDGARLASVIADWVDQDTNRLPQGAEDDHYTALPSPYRTGNQNLASVSELRAMKGFTRDLYATLKPYLCTQPEAKASMVNVNMLAERHAPILAALLGEEVSVLQAEEIIAARPPGGYPDAAAFFEQPAVAALELATQPTDRIGVTSKYMQARAEIVYDTARFEMTVDFEFDDTGNAIVLARRFGAEE